MSLKFNLYLVRCGLALAVLGACASSSAWAAPGGDAFFDEFRRQEQREQQRQQQPEPDVHLAAPTAPVVDALPTEQPCFTVLAIKLKGIPRHRFSWAQPLVDRYLQQCVGVQGINVIMKRLQAEFLARGYITTHVYAPQQDLLSATLELQVVPGMISSIRFAETKGQGSWRAAFPSVGNMLNLRDLEQGLEQMKRLPSQDVDMKLIPGDQPGQTEVVIHRQSVKPWRLTIGADNSGSDTTGKWQGSAVAAYDDPLGLNDLFNVSFNTDTEYRRSFASRGYAAYYSVPWDYWTFTLSASRYRYKQTVLGINESFVSSGRTQQYDFRAQWLLHRAASSKSSVVMHVLRKFSQNFLEDVEILSQRRRVTLAELGVMHRRYMGTLTLDGTLSWRLGVPWLGAQSDPQTQDPQSPTTRYQLWMIDTSLTQPFNVWGTSFRYTANVHGQYTADRVFNSEFFAIGNRYTVRGFDGEATLAAPNGGLLRNELAAPVPQWKQEWYVGLDYGRVGGSRSELGAGSWMLGTAIGVRGQLAGLQYELSAGWPLRKPDMFAADARAYTAQLSYTF